MIGILTREQIDHVLHHQVIGRIGCFADEKMYIVPVTFVYHDNYLYIHSKEGTKINMMRKNPSVCFQVDIIDNMTNWRAVQIWGKFEELSGEDNQRKALNILADRLLPLTLSESVKPLARMGGEAPFLKRGLKPQAFRIKIEEATGRFEKSE